MIVYAGTSCRPLRTVHSVYLQIGITEEINECFIHDKIVAIKPLSILL